MLKHSKVNPPKPHPNLSRNPCFVVNFNPFYKLSWISPKGMGSDSGIMGCTGPSCNPVGQYPGRVG